MQPTHAFILGFDLAALLFLLLAISLLGIRDTDEIRRHAADNDANRVVLLILTFVVVMTILSALLDLLPTSHTVPGRLLILGTLTMAWLFSNSVYALHYAHLYYGSDPEGGLTFSGQHAPDYGDFLYFAFTLGMTFQTSDTAVTTPGFRRLVTLHSLAAFLFNLGVVAFVINTLGSR